MRPVDDGMVVCHVDGAGRAGTLAGTAGNAAVVAHEAGVGALLGVGAARRDVEARVDHVDDVLRAGLGAQAAANAGVLVHVGHAPLVQADGPLAAGVDAGLAANAALLAAVELAVAVAQDDGHGPGLAGPLGGAGLLGSLPLRVLLFVVGHLGPFTR